MSKTAIVLPMQRDGSFGDLMVQGPFLFGLRQLGADRIVIIAPHEYINILEISGLADKVYVIADNNINEISEIFKKEKPHWAISLRKSSFRSSLLVWRCAGAIAIGWSSFLNSILFKISAKRVRDQYYPFVFGRLLSKMGGNIDMNEFSRFVASRNTEKNILITAKRFVFMPNGSFDEKQWGAKNYLELGARLKQKYDDVILIAILGPREEVLKKEFEQFGWHIIVKPSPNYLMAICLGALGIVSNDSGPSHFGQMSGSPIVILYHHDKKNGINATKGIIQLYWWNRLQSFAISTAAPRPLNEIPVNVVFQYLNKAMDQKLLDNFGAFYWK